MDVNQSINEEKLKKDNSYSIVFTLKLLKSIVSTFLDSFFILYFLTLSSKNILPFGIYKLFTISFLFMTAAILKNFSKRKHRIYLLRIGIALNFLYFLAILLLKEELVNHIYALGILYGIEEGFYYCVYNLYESDGIKNEERAKFNGSFTAINAIFSIILPIVFGSFIASNGFLNIVFLFLALILVQLILSFLFKDYNIPKDSHVNFKEYRSKIKENYHMKEVLKINFFNGITYSGAFCNLITIYILRVFADSFSFGIFTSVFALFTFAIGYLFSKKIPQKYYSKMIYVTMLFTIVTLCMMILHCNFFTIILFNFFQTISKTLVDLINGVSQTNLSNLRAIRKEYKVEYYYQIESCLFYGRFISFTLLIMISFIDIIYILPLFILFLILLMRHSVKLQAHATKTMIGSNS